VGFPEGLDGRRDAVEAPGIGEAPVRAEAGQAAAELEHVRPEGQVVQGGKPAEETDLERKAVGVPERQLLDLDLKAVVEGRGIADAKARDVPHGAARILDAQDVGGRDGHAAFRERARTPRGFAGKEPLGNERRDLHDGRPPDIGRPCRVEFRPIRATPLSHRPCPVSGRGPPWNRIIHDHRKSAMARRALRCALTCQGMRDGERREPSESVERANR
jgi:hypothetical protein